MEAHLYISGGMYIVIKGFCGEQTVEYQAKVTVMEAKTVSAQKRLAEVCHMPSSFFPEHFSWVPKFDIDHNLV
eukprot:1535403-Amphidinium_carterae.1